MKTYENKTYIGVTLGVNPEIGKNYLFIADGYLHLGKCIEKDCHYNWTMEELETGKIYYPYNNDIIDMGEKLTSRYTMNINVDYSDNGCDLHDRFAYKHLNDCIKYLRDGIKLEINSEE